MPDFENETSNDQISGVEEPLENDNIQEEPNIESQPEQEEIGQEEPEELKEDIIEEEPKQENLFDIDSSIEALRQLGYNIERKEEENDYLFKDIKNPKEVFEERYWKEVKKLDKNLLIEQRIDESDEEFNERKDKAHQKIAEIAQEEARGSWEEAIKENNRIFNAHPEKQRILEMQKELNEDLPPLVYEKLLKYIKKIEGKNNGGEMMKKQKEQIEKMTNDMKKKAFVESAGKISKESSSLSNEERIVCKKMGLSEENYLKYKNMEG